MAVAEMHKTVRAVVTVSLDDADVSRLEFVAHLLETTVERLIASAIDAIETPEHRTCDQCGTAFRVRDKRMRHCSAVCSRRARRQRERQESAA